MSLVRFKPRKNPHDVDLAVRQMVHHAADDVPFYREAFRRAGVRAGEIHGARDLAKLPIARRDELLASGHYGFLTRGASPHELVCRHTTGATGTPISVYMTRVEAFFRAVTLLDAYRRNVRLPAAFTLVDVGPEQKDRAVRAVQNIGPIRVVRLFRTQPVEDQIEMLRSMRPLVVEGRPTLLWPLARAIEAERNLTVRPRVVISYAEVLYPHVRRLLEQVFACRVADYYNCEEAGNLAWECPGRPGVMHTNPATAWLETVDAYGQPTAVGVEGAVVITNLFNATMPFVRYALGDRATFIEPGRCSCGFEGASMQLVEGRDEDFFVLPDGREVSPRVVYDVVNRALPPGGVGDALARAIRAFQIVQEERARMVVRVVPGPMYRDDLWRALPDRVRILHPEMKAEIHCVNALEPGLGGKFRQVMSNVGARRFSDPLSG